MSQWIETREFMTCTGLKKAGACKAIAEKRWKKKPLQVRQVKNENGGRPKWQVLWDEKANAPATGESHENIESHSKSVVQFVPVAKPDSAPATVKAGEGNNVVSILQKTNKNSTDSLDRMDSLPANPNRVCEASTSYESNLRNSEKNANVGTETQTPQVLPSQDLDKVEKTVSGEVLTIEQEFETLLHRYLTDTRHDRQAKIEKKLSEDAEFKKRLLLDSTGTDVIALFEMEVKERVGNAERAIKSQTRKEFKQTKQIPEKLFYKETRGRKSGLEWEVQTRFSQMLQDAANAELTPDRFITQANRHLTTLERRLRTEFPDLKFSYAQLRTFAEKFGLTKYLKQEDGEDGKVIKERGTFPDIPVWDWLQMDGVSTDYVKFGKILDNCKPITCIGIYDVGSRRWMAFKEYWTETNQATVDVMIDFLQHNKLPQKDIFLSPDNGSAFRAVVKKVMRVVNKKHCLPDGFNFIDSYTRVRMPKDKVHQERAHGHVHDLEEELKDLLYKAYPDKFIGYRDQQKDMGGGRKKQIKVAVYDLSLDEVRAVGWADYVKQTHNNKMHSFTVEGKRTRWNPEVKFQKYMAGLDSFVECTEQDFESCKIYGYPKSGKRTVQKDDNGGKYITINSQAHNLVDLDKIQAGQEVETADLGGGVIAVYELGDDGEFLTQAVAVKSGVKTEKAVIKIEEKKERNVKRGAQKAIEDLFNSVALPFNEKLMNELIAEGLTAAIAAVVIQENDNIRNGDGSEKANGMRWLRFCEKSREKMEVKAKTTFKRGNS